MCDTCDFDNDLMEACLEWLAEYAQDDDRILFMMEEKFHSTLESELTEFAYTYIGMGHLYANGYASGNSAIAELSMSEEDCAMADDIVAEVEANVSDALHYFFRHMTQPRSLGVEWVEDTFFESSLLLHLKQKFSDEDDNDSLPQFSFESDNEPETKASLAKKIAWIRSQPQPAQRTPEWFVFRSTLLSASDIHKVFGTEHAKNTYIREKCKAYQETHTSTSSALESDGANSSDGDGCDGNTRRTVSITPAASVRAENTETAMHWGVRYEPVTAEWYSHTHACEIGEFGCIRHRIHSFLGASPDGIVVNPNSSRYGRMIEIKNIVNREITGIPKKGYWIQMQMQLEVCNLEHCDFIETRFIEYDNEREFLKDAPAEHVVVLADEAEADANAQWKNEMRKVDRTASGKWKGVMIHFYNSSTGAAVYIRKPIGSMNYYNQLADWRASTVETYTNEPYNYLFVRTIYWRLDQVSELVVKRNRDWFRAALPHFQAVWKQIEEKREKELEEKVTLRRKNVEPVEAAPVLRLSKPMLTILNRAKDAEPKSGSGTSSSDEGRMADETSSVSSIDISDGASDSPPQSKPKLGMERRNESPGMMAQSMKDQLEKTRLVDLYAGFNAYRFQEADMDDPPSPLSIPSPTSEFDLEEETSPRARSRTVKTVSGTTQAPVTNAYTSFWTRNTNTNTLPNISSSPHFSHSHSHSHSHPHSHTSQFVNIAVNKLKKNNMT